MATWKDLREEVLGMLDVKVSASTASDIRNLVDIKLERLRDKLYSLRRPRSLLVYTDPETVDSSTVAIKITGTAAAGYPSFDLSDFDEVFTLAIEGEDWQFVPWEAWIRSNNAVGGNQRPRRSWTIDYQNYLYLSSVPEGSDTWEAVLHYYKTPATITDLGTPEIGKRHESLLVVGVAVQFPNLFQGEERTIIFQSLMSQEGRLMKDFMRERPARKSDAVWRPRIIRKNVTSTVWGNGETS